MCQRETREKVETRRIRVCNPVDAVQSTTTTKQKHHNRYKLKHRKEASKELQLRKAHLGKDMANRMDQLRSRHSKSLETITRQYLEKCENEQCIQNLISEARQYEQESQEYRRRKNMRLDEKRQTYESKLIVMKRDAMSELKNALDRLRSDHARDLKEGTLLTHSSDISIHTHTH